MADNGRLRLSAFVCRCLLWSAIVCGCLLWSAVVSPVSAQDTTRVRSGNDPCFRAQPYPACRVFFLTDAGVFVRLTHSDASANSQSPLRAVVDWGAMVNLSRTNAIGGSWFAALDENGFSTGPVLHWRRWLANAKSIDVAVGTPIAGGNALRPGSVLGLVKYNPVHWFGVAVRPELIRAEDYICGTSSCTYVRRTRGRVYLGAETGWFPGLGLGLGAGVTLGVLVIALLAGGGID